MCKYKFCVAGLINWTRDSTAILRLSKNKSTTHFRFCLDYWNN